MPPNQEKGSSHVDSVDYAANAGMDRPSPCTAMGEKDPVILKAHEIMRSGGRDRWRRKACDGQPDPRPARATSSTRADAQGAEATHR